MMSTPCRGPSNRLIPDPSISVADLIAAVEQYLTGMPDRDLNKHILQVINAGRTRSSADACTMAKLSNFFQGLASVAPNGVLPSKKFQTALRKIHENGKINMTQKSDDDFFDTVDSHVRFIFSHYRELCIDPLKRERAFKMVAPWERDNVMKVIKLLNLADHGMSALETPEKFRKIDSDTSLALVPQHVQREEVSFDYSIFWEVLSKEKGKHEQERAVDTVLESKTTSSFMQGSFRSLFSSTDTTLLESCNT